MSQSRLLIAACCLLLTVCASSPRSGIMVADWTPPAKAEAKPQKVMIPWESNSRITGQMTFTLGPKGQRFVGDYVLIEKTQGHVAATPLYDAWEAGSFDGWTMGAVDPWFEPSWGMSVWVDHYDGRVVALLSGNRGGQARCHFTLRVTEAGLEGGGTGECQVNDGGHLAASF